MGSIPRPPIVRILLIQLAILSPLGVAAWVVNATLGYSLVLGGLIQILPNLYFVVHALQFRGARAMPKAVRMLYKGEMGKFALTIAGFVALFVLVKPINVFAVFVAYLTMLVVSAVATYTASLSSGY